MSVHYKLYPFYVCLLLVNLLLKTLIEAQRVSTWSKFHVFCSKTRENEWLGRWHDLRLLSDECRSSLCSRLRQEKRWVIKRLTAIADCLFFNGLLHLIGIHPLWICLGWCRQVNYVQLCPGGSIACFDYVQGGNWNMFIHKQWTHIKWIAPWWPPGSYMSYSLHLGWSQTSMLLMSVFPASTTNRWTVSM